MKKQIIAAILEQDIREVEKKLHQVSGLLDWAQIDFVDGAFVNNVTIDVTELEGINHDLNLSAHLMVVKPQEYLKDCKKLGFQQIVFHFESECNHGKIIEEIDDLEMEKVMALNIDTPLESILPYVDRLDGVLLMSIKTGFGGQEFIEAALDRIKELAILAPDTDIYVDGGIELDNIQEISAAGANGFIIGTAIFQSNDIEETIKELKSKVK